MPKDAWVPLNERTCIYTTVSVCLSFGNLICGAALLFFTLHSVLLHPQMQYLDGQRRRVVVFNRTLRPLSVGVVAILNTSCPLV